MAFKTKVLGREALSRKLNALAPAAEAAAATAKIEVAREAASLIAANAPHKSGDYRDSIKGERQADNPTKQPIGGVPSKDPDATAVYAEYIWRFLEFGTKPHINKGQFAGTQHPGTVAQPHVFTTWRAYRPRALRKVRNALNKAVRQAMGKR